MRVINFRGNSTLGDGASHAFNNLKLLCCPSGSKYVHFISKKERKKIKLGKFSDFSFIHTFTREAKLFLEYTKKNGGTKIIEKQIQFRERLERRRTIPVFD